MSDWDKIGDALRGAAHTVGDVYRDVSPGRVNPPKVPGDPQISMPKWKAPDPWFENDEIKRFAVDTSLKYVQMQMAATQFGMSTMNQAFNPMVKLQYVKQLEQDWNDGYYIRSVLGFGALMFLGNATVPVSIYDAFFPYQNPTRDRHKPSFKSYGDWWGPSQGEDMANLMGFRHHYQDVYKNMQDTYNWAEWNVWGRYKKKPKGGKDDRYERVKKFREQNPWNP